MLPVFDDLTITITATEPPAQGANVTVSYANATTTGAFSLAAVAAQVDALKLALQQSDPVREDLCGAGAALFLSLIHISEPTRPY